MEFCWNFPGVLPKFSWSSGILLKGKARPSLGLIPFSRVHPGWEETKFQGFQKNLWALSIPRENLPENPSQISHISSDSVESRLIPQLFPPFWEKSLENSCWMFGFPWIIPLPSFPEPFFLWNFPLDGFPRASRNSQILEK